MKRMQFIGPGEIIRHLRDELYQARWALITLGLIPEEAQRLLRGYYGCESREETHHWERDAVGGIIALAKPLPHEHVYEIMDRFLCPLCGEESTTIYYTGFTAEGLRRHLIGWGNNRQCEVMGAALKLARDHWHDKFHEAEETEVERERARAAERRKVETLYRTAPREQPRLIDEGLSGDGARDEASLAWAEARLAELGLVASAEGNVNSYTAEGDGFVVYADPRPRGEIRFVIYRASVTKGKKPRVLTKYRGSFSLKDTWKKDLRSKYEDRLAQLTAPR